MSLNFHCLLGQSEIKVAVKLTGSKVHYTPCYSCMDQLMAVACTSVLTPTFPLGTLQLFLLLERTIRYYFIIIATTVIIITKVSSPKLTWASGLFERLSNLCTAPINTFQGACYFKVGHDQDTKLCQVQMKWIFFPGLGLRSAWTDFVGGGAWMYLASGFYQRVYRSFVLVIYHPQASPAP